MCSEVDETAAGDADSQSSDDDMYSRHINLVHRRRSYQELRSLAMRLQPSASSSGGGGAASSSGRSAPERNARGTQTARRIQFSIATQTEDVSTNNTSAQSATENDERGAGTSGNSATNGSESEMTEMPSTSGTSSASAQQDNADQSSMFVNVGSSTSSASNSAESESIPANDGDIQHTDL